MTLTLLGGMVGNLVAMIPSSKTKDTPYFDKEKLAKHQLAHRC